MTTTYITMSEASRWFPGFTLELWRFRGILPHDQRGNLDPIHLKRIATFSKTDKPSLFQATLCYLEWLTLNGHHKQEVAREVELLAESGHIIFSETVALTLGYSRRQVTEWAKQGFLPSVRVMCRFGKLYSIAYAYIPRDIKRIKHILNSSTSYEAAERLHMSVGGVNRLARKGKIAATSTPAGWRFSDSAIAEYLAQQHVSRGLLQGQILEMLAMSPAAFNQWCAGGFFPVLGVNAKGNNLYDPEAVAQVKAERETIRGDFAWLSTIGDRRYTPQAAARRLGISTHSLSVWTAEQLLPYFDLRPPTCQRQQRQYVASYVDLFIKHAAPGPPNKQAARQFKQHMRAHYESHQ